MRRPLSRSAREDARPTAIKLRKMTRNNRDARSTPSPPQAGRVALLGIAYRHISVKFTQKTRKPSQPKPLPASMKTMADWIAVKLHQHKMAPYHLAFKMGIATSVVIAWKDGTAKPKACHVRHMSAILGLANIVRLIRCREHYDWNDGKSGVVFQNSSKVNPSPGAICKSVMI